MESLFVQIHRFLAGRKGISLFIFTLLVAAMAYVASGLRIEENLNAIIPEDKRITRISEAFDKSQLADQLIFMLSMTDSLKQDPAQLIRAGQELVDLLEQKEDLLKSIRFKVSGDAMLEIYDFIYENLPLFLDEEDYEVMGEMLSPEKIDQSIAGGFRTLISPTGMVSGKYILKDPLNLTPLALKKLRSFQLDDNFTIYNSAIFTKDYRYLLIFLDPANPGSNTQENLKLIRHIEWSIDQVINEKDLIVDYYGGTAVAVSNSVRVKKDIALTLSIAFFFFLLIFLIFFRNIRIVFLMFLPVLTGSLASIAILSLIYGQVSAIGLGVGVIFMGITVDYSLHFFTHLRAGSTIADSLGRITLPIFMSAVTTASAFLCLSIVKSEALNQIGIFAAFAVIFAAFSVLLISPLLIRNDPKGIREGRSRASVRIEKWVAYSFEKNRILVLALLLLTLLFAFTSQKIRFNGDISTLNYMSDRLSKSEAKLKSISSVANSSVYLVSKGNSLEEVLEKVESSQLLLDSCKNEGLFSEISTVSDLMRSRQAQQIQIDQWNQFWDAANRENTMRQIRKSGLENHFRDHAFQPFFDMLEKNFQPIGMEAYGQLMDLFLHNFISSEGDSWSVVSILMVDPANKPELFERLEGREDFIIFDQLYFINQFFDVLKEDFNKLVSISMVVVFFILLIFFGRIEIALITFIPIMVSWMWTLGLMGLFRIEINIFNIIISTFIFGLGIDYAIFIMNGILANYREGRHSLAPYKLSILLSALTTISAIGVLIFAKHPALRSIALVSIFGISTVLIISYTLLPLLFNFLVKSRGKPRLEPLSFTGVLSSLMFFIFFLGSGLVASLLLPLIILWPAKWSRKRKLVSYLIFLGTRMTVKISFTVRKKYINKELADFSSPSVIISNHQSQLDLVFLLQLNPRMIVLVNKWVWNNPFYGFIIRFAGYYPVYKGLDYNLEALKKKVSEGYSILAFPEGSRSPDGSIRRFHQGALGIADMLDLEILPVVIHGAYEALPKSELFLKPGSLTMQFHPKIRPAFEEFEGIRTYRLQAKELTAFYRKAYRGMQEELGNTSYYRNNLIGRFLYKGPVLEWYMRVKLKMEQNYSFYHETIPREARVLDLGCGYGFLSIMLGLCSDQRKITGVDYDERKIATARMAAQGLDHLSFLDDDISTFQLPGADVYILNDVLHYLSQAMQMDLLERCMDTLQPGGKIILRDADAALKKRTRYTKFTEFQSTRVFRFNKKSYPLTFIPASSIEKLCEKKGCQWERIDHSRFTSNVTYMISR